VPSVIFIDGVLTPRERATVSVFDRGFLYGDTVFETLRVYGGKPFLETLHLERLRRSADLVGIDLPTSDEGLAEELQRAIHASGETEAVVRVTVSRGEAPLGIDPCRATHPRRLVFVEPLGVRASGSAPIAVRLVTSRRGADLAPAAKIGAYVDAILALRVAQAAGDDEAVLVDSSGFVLEATTANVFAIDAGGRLVTPREGAILAGITRGEVLRIARAEGLAPLEQPISAEALRCSREIFVTSSVREIVAVGRVDRAVVGTGAMGPVTARLLEVYRAAVPRGP